uniref:Uncharacterized protein n=1 Tax=Alexandrium catenella TaxID=2925 RepID=A0A7S1WLM4_ALECA|mmetsp:Transcript_72083/g.191544  ORF Transcript_72083/g.191544 Transcript_72083/m.191544 type:complete len:108 (+) Transcript_72083:143-466(+)
MATLEMPCMCGLFWRTIGVVGREPAGVWLAGCPEAPDECVLWLCWPGLTTGGGVPKCSPWEKPLELGPALSVARADTGWLPGGTSMEPDSGPSRCEFFRLSTGEFGS